MKVGDVVGGGLDYGIVVEADECGYVAEFEHWTSCCGVAVKGEAVLLTIAQRAFVDATIAAEALRRIG